MQDFFVTRHNPVSVQSRDSLEWAIGLRTATGLIGFGGQPEDGDLLVLNDGVTEYTYQFVTVLDPIYNPYFRILIGIDLDTTILHTIIAINLNCATHTSTGEAIVDPERGIFAQDDTSEYGYQIALINTKPGELANVEITTTSDDLVVSGMSGGIDAKRVGTESVLWGAFHATVSSSDKLPHLFGFNVPATISRITLVPRGGGTIYYSFDSGASATDELLPTGGIDFGVTASSIETMELFAASVICDLWVSVWREE